MITDLKPYPKMKDSGIEWLGEIPQHWSLDRGKRLFARVERPVCGTDEVVTCFRDGTVTLRKNRRTQGFTESLKEIGYQGIRVGDLVIHAMDAFAGAVGVADSDGKGTPVYAVCKPNLNADAHYHAFVIREMARSQWILALATGIRERSTDFRFGTYANQRVPVPPLPEQVAIVRYLDHVDRRVRRLVRAKRKLITLLTEQKQAIIHRAVTRGLDPNVCLKDSGVEWLGDAPEHWSRYRLKSLLKSVDRRSVDASEPLLSLRRDHGIVLYADHFERPPPAVSLVGYKIVTPGQIVVNRLQANNGLIFRSDLRGLTSPDYSVFEARPIVEPEFVARQLRTSAYKAYFRSVATGLGTGSSGFLRLYDDDLLQTVVFLPGLQEQAAILDRLDEMTNEADRPIGRVGREIQLLNEYRIRLIADVVTGKLDIREAAAALPEADPLDSEGELDNDLDTDNETLTKELDAILEEAEA